MRFFVCIWLLLAGFALAQEKAPVSSKAPKAEAAAKVSGPKAKAAEVLDQSARASISEKVAAEFESLVTLGSMTVPPGIEGGLKIYTKKGGKIFSQITIQTQGLNMEVVQGCDGQNCYSKDPTLGLRLLDGQEKEMMLFQNDMVSAMDWRGLYSSYEYKGMGEVSGRPTHLVYLETAGGATMTNFYDAENYRLLKSEGNYAGPMGNFTYTTDYLDYKEVTEGLIIPMRMETQMMAMSLTMRIDQVEYNVPIPDSKFKLPAGLVEE